MESNSSITFRWQYSLTQYCQCKEKLDSGVDGTSQYCGGIQVAGGQCAATAAMFVPLQAGVCDGEGFSQGRACSAVLLWVPDI